MLDEKALCLLSLVRNEGQLDGVQYPQTRPRSSGWSRRWRSAPGGGKEVRFRSPPPSSAGLSSSSREDHRFHDDGHERRADLSPRRDPW